MAKSRSHSLILKHSLLMAMLLGVSLCAFEASAKTRPNARARAQASRGGGDLDSMFESVENVQHGNLDGFSNPQTSSSSRPSRTQTNVQVYVAPQVSEAKTQVTITPVENAEPATTDAWADVAPKNSPAYVPARVSVPKVSVQATAPQVQTNTNDAWADVAEAQTCIGCATASVTGSTMSQPYSTASAVNAAATSSMGPSRVGTATANWSQSQAPQIRAGYYSEANQCDKIMDDRTGMNNDIGESVARVILSSTMYDYFMRGNALGSFCPRFSQLSEQRKLQAWVWFWRSLADEESSCIVTRRHSTFARTKRGRRYRLNPEPGYGLWALELNRSTRIRQHRGPNCNDISSSQGQALCAVSIMRDTQLDEAGHTASNDSGSYWGPVRRGTRQIIPHMQRFVECF
jgi:hypothetical protein